MSVILNVAVKSADQVNCLKHHCELFMIRNTNGSVVTKQLRQCEGFIVNYQGTNIYTTTAFLNRCNKALLVLTKYLHFK